MSNFNLAKWSLEHKSLVYFFIALVFLTGIFSYNRLGRMEDPDFVVRQMVVTVGWPGATARQVEEQVTDKIEKKLQDTPGIKYLKSYSRPGQSVIYVNLDSSVATKDIRSTWVEVRNMVNDIKPTLPEGVVGPAFNDRFDDVFGCIYAITADGYSYEEMRQQAEDIRQILLGVKNVKKVNLIGVQAEKIYIEMENNKLSQLGIDPQVIINTIKMQNSMAPAGMIDTATDNVYLRVTGIFDDMDAVKNLPISANNRTFRLGDIAKIERGYSDPAEPKMYFNGQPAIGLALAMSNGGNILDLGKNLDQTISQVKKELPLGLEIHPVANQPKVVTESIDEFVQTLKEAVIIVLIVSFISLGVRSGIVVALCIPLVIAGVFVMMKMLGIDLHKVSLGALIIALGLLVDDAIIIVEMMIVKMEEGWNKFEAACYAYTAAAYPMLSGTLVTCAGFIPVSFSKGDASEFVGSIFTVVTLALIISWVVAGVVTPLIGYKIIKVKAIKQGETHDPYNSKFYVYFKKLLVWCLHHRKLVLGVTMLIFIGSLLLFKFIRQEFFPPSLRPELIVELRLPEGSSLKATETEAQKFAQCIESDPNIESYAYYVGQGAPRFILTAEPVLPSSNYAQFIIVSKNIEARKALNQKISGILADQFDNVRGLTKVLQTGPADPYPVMLRVSGNDHEKVRQIAEQVRAQMMQNSYIDQVTFDWNEKNKVMHLQVDQDKARALGISSQRLAFDLQTQLSGAPIAEFREENRTISMVFKMYANNTKNLANIKDLNVHIGNGKYVPLEQIAKISFDAEEGLIWRRDLKPTITVQATIKPGITGNDAAKQVYGSLAELRESLPMGYGIDISGSLERSKESTKNLLDTVPIMVVVIVILLMLQLQNMPRMLLTLLTAPLGVIGVSIALLLTQRPMGFVAQLGILALGGIIIRNSIILIDKIETMIADGESPWDAVIHAAVIRFRPIMLTAAAAILGMVPLASSIFWGPMAVAIAGGLFVATILTLLVLPTMYVAWYKLKPNK